MPRPARQFRSASKENFEAFCTTHPKINIDYATFKKVIYNYNEMYANHFIDTGDRMKLPYGFGPLAVTKYKPKGGYKTASNGKQYPNKAIDWAATSKEGKIMYHLNAHTDGYKYYWYWSPYESYLRQSNIWKFEMARIHSRTLSKYLKNPNDNHKDLYKQWKFKS